jgi:hypothetical protein
MTDGSPPGTADKSFGEIVTDVSEKASLLIREEIELAKAEVQEKIGKLAKGAVAGLVGGFFLFLMLIYLLHGLAYLFVDLLDTSEVWIGYLIVTGLLLLGAATAGLLALRLFKRGAPPTPELAIEEAKKTRITLEATKPSRDALDDSKRAGDELFEEART